MNSTRLNKAAESFGNVFNRMVRLSAELEEQKRPANSSERAVIRSAIERANKDAEALLQEPKPFPATEAAAVSQGDAAKLGAQGEAKNPKKS